MSNGGFDVRWRGSDGTVRKIAFEETVDGHDRVEYRWQGCNWIVVGREPVTDVALEASMLMCEMRRGP